MYEGRDATGRHLTASMRSMLGGATWWREELDTRRGEDAPGAGEGYFRDILEKAAVGVMLEDAGGRLVESNPAMRALLGYSEDELLGLLRSDVTHPEDEAKDAKLYEELFRGEREGFRTERRYVRKDGSVVWGRLSASLLTDAGGRFALAVGVVEDIDERKKTEGELEKREERYRAMVEQSTEGIFLADAASGRVLETNPALRALLGYAAGELRRMEVYDLIVDPGQDLDREVRLALEERGRFVDEWKLRRKDGSLLDVEVSVGGISYGGREAVCTTVREATERKRAEEALRASERRVWAVIEQSPLSVHVFSPEGRSLVSNASWNELWGFGEGESPEGNIFEDEQLAEAGLLEYVRESLEGGRVTTPPLFYDPARTGRAGPARWLEAYVYPVEGGGGAVREMVLVIEDVTGREEVREELEKSEERFRSMVRNSSDVVMILEADGTIRYESPAVERVLGHRTEERVGARILDYVHPEDVERTEAAFDEVRETPGVRPPTRFRQRHKDGSWRHVEAVRNNLLDDPNIGGIVVNVRDVTERVRAEEEIRLKNRAIDASSNGILICDMTQEDYPIVYGNAAMASVTGYAPEEILGRNPRFLQGADREQVEARRLSTAIAEGREWFGVIRNYKKDGTLFYNEMYVAPVRDEGGNLTHYLGVQNDVTERKAMEEQLAYQAFHDSLTGLPNRALFKDRLEQALGRADRHKNAVAVLFMDLDNFKYVNDSLGHEAGDELLIGVAERLRWGIRPGDTAARHGGDEFAVLIEEVGVADDATKVAGRIAEELREPLMIRGQEIFVSASIGVASSARSRAGDLLRDADAAMYEAKREGKNRYKVFEPGMGHGASERLGLENALRRAMRRGELRLHYQPEVLLQDGRTAGVEALLRWERPGQGLVTPAGFISVAEETGLIVPMGHWVLREACRQAREWRGRYVDGEVPTVWVNLSARQIHQADLAGEVSGILDEAGLPPGGLGLEITESVLVEYGGAAVSTLDELRALGVKLAIDDFGTGYSSLSYLKRLPVDVLKVDRSFVAGIDKSAEDEVLVSAVINLAQALNLKVVAEGVETPDQLQKLRSLGCDLAQGYLFSHPLPAEAALPLLFEGW